MYKGKYGAVIGRETRFLYVPSNTFPGYGMLLANHSAVFTLAHQTAEFRQTTV